MLRERAEQCQPGSPLKRSLHQVHGIDIDAEAAVRPAGKTGKLFRTFPKRCGRPVQGQGLEKNLVAVAVPYLLERGGDGAQDAAEALCVQALQGTSNLTGDPVRRLFQEAEVRPFDPQEDELAEGGVIELPANSISRR